MYTHIKQLKHCGYIHNKTHIKHIQNKWSTGAMYTYTTNEALGFMYTHKRNETWGFLYTHTKQINPLIHPLENSAEVVLLNEV